MLPVTASIGSNPSNTVPVVEPNFSKKVTFDKDEFARRSHYSSMVEGARACGLTTTLRTCLLGDHLAAKLGVNPGDPLLIGRHSASHRRILSTGAAEDDQVRCPALPGRRNSWVSRAPVRRIYVSALTKPEDAFARRDPRTMTPEMFERWNCSPYAQSISYQLQGAIPPPMRNKFVRSRKTKHGSSRIRPDGCCHAGCPFASALAVSAAMATAMFERRVEVGLMRALGAGSLSVALLFFAEALLLALIGRALSDSGPGRCSRTRSAAPF